jgi:hypothetical protein
VLAQARVHVEEEHALRLEVGLELVVDDFRLVLRADTGEELALGLGDSEDGIGRASKYSSDLRRNLRIQSGSSLCAEIASTTSRVSPRWDLKK